MGLKINSTFITFLCLFALVNCSTIPQAQVVPLAETFPLNNNNGLPLTLPLQQQPLLQPQPQQLAFDPLGRSNSVQQQAIVAEQTVGGNSQQTTVQATNVGPIQVIDPKHFKNSFRKSKANKVSSLLHYFHGLSNDSVYDPKQVEDVTEILKQPDFKKMSDEEVLKYLCSEKWTSVCEKTVRLAIDKKPKHVADIVQAIRNKPAYVNANKLLWHKLFEKAITKVEENNYDEKLNTVINTAATKNPYLFAASKIIDKAV